MTQEEINAKFHDLYLDIRANKPSVAGAITRMTLIAHEMAKQMLNEMVPAVVLEQDLAEAERRGHLSE